MSELEKEFIEASEKVKTLNKKPSDDELLELYGLYKQATIGDINTTKPNMLDIKGNYKWSAWDICKGMNKEKAMRKYIRVVKRLENKY
jgi:diazepam-binding inhibitor (GABA receptor modulating acyl-CoA-binding protein)